MKFAVQVLISCILVMGFVYWFDNSEIIIGNFIKYTPDPPRQLEIIDKCETCIFAMNRGFWEVKKNQVDLTLEAINN